MIRDNHPWVRGVYVNKAVVITQQLLKEQLCVDLGRFLTHTYVLDATRSLKNQMIGSKVNFFNQSETFFALKSNIFEDSDVLITTLCKTSNQIHLVTFLSLERSLRLC
jgi:hypothetical protein